MADVGHDRRQPQILHFFLSPYFASALVALIAGLTLLGWIFDVPRLKDLLEARLPTNPVTAVTLILASISLWLLGKDPTNRGRLRAAQICAILVALVGLIKMGENIGGWEFAIDRLLFPQKLQNAPLPWLNQIAPHTALCCLLFGLALLLLNARGGRNIRLAQILALIAGFISWTAIIGYLYNITAIHHEIVHIPMAFNTAVAFVFLCIGILSARPHSGLMASVTSASPGGVMARRLLPAFILLPTLLGWLRYIGEEKELFDAASGVALMSVTMSIFTVGIILWSASWLDRLDAERTRNTEALKTSEQRTRMIIENANDSFIAIDSDGRIIDWNPQAKITFGWNREEIIGQPIATTIIPDQFRQAHLKGFEHFLTTGEGPVLNKRIELIGLHRDGHEFPLEITISPIRWNSTYIFNAFVHDITERKRANEQLRQTEERLRLLVESVRDYAIFMLDPTGQVMSWNPGAERLKGYEAPEVIGTHFSRFYPPEDIARGKPQRELEIALAEGRVEDEGWRVRKDGSQFWANVSITPVYDNKKNLRGFSKVTRDLTERKRAEEEIHKLNEGLEQKVIERTRELDEANIELKQKHAEMEQFLYTVSHDLKSPLVTILGYSGYIKEDTAEGRLDRVTEFLDEIGIAVNRMVRLINGLLDLGRISLQNNPPQAVPMTELIQGIVQQHQVEITERNVSIDIQEEMPTLYMDRERLLEAFDNLLVNALTHGCGAPQPRITIGAVTVDNEIKFFVKDNGQGIPKPYQAKIFELFQRLKNDRKGTGLGLTIVKRVAEVHGGQAWVESQPGEGATFWLAFPHSIVKVGNETDQKMAYSRRSDA